MHLTESQIHRIEEQLNDVGYENVEFVTIDMHPADETVLLWFTQDKPQAQQQNVRARLDFASNRPPYIEIV